jgi:hypothetical protein
MSVVLALAKRSFRAAQVGNLPPEPIRVDVTQADLSAKRLEGVLR